MLRRVHRGSLVALVMLGCPLPAGARGMAADLPSGLVAGLCSGAFGAGPGGAMVTRRVSVDATGHEGSSASTRASISADGRCVAFASSAANLVPGGTNGRYHAMVHDCQTGQTTLASVSSTGAQSNGDIRMLSTISISADGRCVAFVCDATNLVAGDTNGCDDVFVHDRQTGQTIRVSVDSEGGQGNGVSNFPSLSADGRRVAFASDATSLVPGDTNGCRDVFVHDRETHRTTRVSADSAGAQGDGTAESPSMSADGRYVAFWSRATNLVPSDTNRGGDVFVHDLGTRRTTRVSVDTAGNQCSGGIARASISADGRYVVFRSTARDLVPGVAVGPGSVFVHDVATGETACVSPASPGMGGHFVPALWLAPVISANGRYIVFESTARGLLPEGTTTHCDVYLHDRWAHETTRVSVDPEGRRGNGASAYGVISADGRYVAFSSTATNLTPADTNESSDVFVADRGVPE